jgi:hypothetical protein
MSSTLKRQLNDEEKEVILKRFGRHCFATGHQIPADEQLQFDHIKAHSLGGDSDLNNIAPMCGTHNKEKGQLSLGDFRIKLQLEEFFATGDRLTLRDLLLYQKKEKQIENFGASVVVHAENGQVTIDSTNGKLVHSLYKCPITDWHYFYATLDVALLDSDDDDTEGSGLQPRYLIKDKVFSLFRHFQNHPVLQPSIGRLAGSHIRLFDGQHKAAALLLNSRKSFECKIYLDPDLRLLNDTNISAHDAFAQTRFYSSIMILKLGAEFAQDFEDFKKLDLPTKSEAAFFGYLLNKASSLLTKADLNKRFRSHLYSSVLNDSQNKLSKYISAANRSTDEQPITMDMLEKSIFAKFLFREPTSDDMTSVAYRRDDEQQNVISLCNDIVDAGLYLWDPKAATNHADRIRLQRIFGSKSMMAWSELLADAIAARLELVDVDEKEKMFFRALTPQQANVVRKTVQRLFDWQRWAAPKDDQIDRVLSDKKTAVKDWFRQNGLTTGYLMGASE